MNALLQRWAAVYSKVKASAAAGVIVGLLAALPQWTSDHAELIAGLPGWASGLLTFLVIAVAPAAAGYRTKEKVGQSAGSNEGQPSNAGGDVKQTGEHANFATGGIIQPVQMPLIAGEPTLTDITTAAARDTSTAVPVAPPPSSPPA